MIARVVAIAVVVVLIVTGCAPRQAASPPAVPPAPSPPQPAPPAPSPSPAPPPSGSSDQATTVDHAIDSAAAAADALPRDSFDPHAVLRQVGTDPTALFTWVRDSTRFVPYRGSLRGTVGVLMDRMGNSLDRALLLGELYRLAGISTRLAHATLGAEQVNTVLATVRLPKMSVGSPSRDVLLADAEQRAKSAGLDARQARDQLQATWDRTHTMAMEARGRSRTQAEKLARIVGSAVAAGPSLAPDAADHWWLQWSRDGQWVDADPTLPDASVGAAMTAPAETMTVEDLPPAVFHQLTIRVIIEQATENSSAEHVVLTRTLRAAAHLGQRITLVHAPLQWPSDVFAGSDPAAGLRPALVGVREWLPILQVGDSPAYDEAFSILGDAGTPILGPAAAPGGLFGAATRELTTVTTGKTPDGRLTAEWIEYELRAPGAPPSVTRREIFDLLGPAARRQHGRIPAWGEAQKVAVGLTLLGETEILPIVGDVSSEFATSLAAQEIAAQRAILRQLAGASDSAALGTLPTPTAAPRTPGLYPLAVARRVWSPVRDDVYIDAVNIFSAHTSYVLSGQGELSARTRFDLVATGIGVRPGADAFRTRLEQGVADTNIEAWFARGPLPAATENTADLFAAATDQQIDWILVRSAADPTWRSVTLPADARARIEAALADGAVVVVPRRAVTLNGRPSVAWWRIDPRSGQTLGIDAAGGGGAASEGAILIRNMSLLATGVSVFFCTLAFGRVSKISYAAGLAICLLTWGAVGTSVAFAGALRALAAIILHIINVLYLDRVIRSAAPD
ncbi:MAG TPA: hypothetical protein VGK88_13365 [bacterium]